MEAYVMNLNSELFEGFHTEKNNQKKGDGEDL